MHPWSADICEEKWNVLLKRLKSYQKVRWAEIVENTKNLGSPNRIHKKNMQRWPQSRYSKKSLGSENRTQTFSKGVLGCDSRGNIDYGVRKSDSKVINISVWLGTLN